MVGKLTNRKKKATTRNGNRGVKALNQVAFEMVVERAEEIAEALMKATQEGHVMSIQLLIELAAGNLDAETAEAMRPFRKLLLDLAAEAQLPAEALDAAEEAVKQ